MSYIVVDQEACDCFEISNVEHIPSGYNLFDKATDPTPCPTLMKLLMIKFMDHPIKR